MLGSVQEKLNRVRPPRVKITYDVETGGAIEQRELPFIVGIFADLTGDPVEPLPPVKVRKMVDIDRDNFDYVLAASAPRVKLSAIANEVDGQGKLSGDLLLNQLEDFDPLSVVKKIPKLNEIYEQRCRLRDMQAKLESSDALTQLLDDMVSESPSDDATKVKDDLLAAFNGKTVEEWSAVETNDTLNKLLSRDYMLLNEQQRSHVLLLLGQFVQSIVSVLDAVSAKGASTALLIDDSIAKLDDVLGRQLNLILHHPPFQQLEATWRGLYYLVSRTETGQLLKLKVLNISKHDLLKDLEKAVEFDQSAIFKMIYEAEYGTYGGYPYSLLVGDYEFGRHPQDIELLIKMSSIAAAAHAPFIAAASAQLFDIDTFTALGRPRDLAKIFESVEMDGWRTFRETEDSRYVSLTLPNVLLRLPYGMDTQPVDGLPFEEIVSSKNYKMFLWGNPAYMLAERITNAFALYGWVAAIRGVEGGGVISGLPTYKYKTDEGDIAMMCPTQVAITDRREKELNDLGFMAICHCKGSNKAAFFGGQTTNKPKKYISDEANANAQISAMLPYVLCASRFAHFIKVIMRDKVGKFMTRANVEQFLNNWISQYILLDDDASQEVKAAYPLRAAQIQVTDVPGKPGAYRATVFIKPHFQLEELTTSIRLVADLPA
ncbi:type VI secretion system contractile sheath large subunit [Zooshikella ganghwensis]|uniref:Type VI secretion system contractile sheath large subunit n=1 Tax=Zooshikella ganghwensis TaxID=202772 RepID=A0A4P9VN32_9GAMM|nr:type VI secretion system contractile sheath large subunit [Zooshikella ganghwensis]RDH43817.1 type VI secretion system contractile sheath large subunit [Zooshikella ganghwensis]